MSALDTAPSVDQQTAWMPLYNLDVLWFQITGFVCNLSCNHCFISCSPTNQKLDFLTREQVQERCEEGKSMGLKEIYFTGGEPFIHPEIADILNLARTYAPTTVLTNATLFKEECLTTLACSDNTHPLTFRVSIDGPTAESNDAIRGKGAFEKAVQGIQKLLNSGFTPIVTCMQSWPDSEHQNVISTFKSLFERLGNRDIPLKILPPLLLGEQANTDRPYNPDEQVTEACFENFDKRNLQCSGSRMVTSKGVYVCPILVDDNDGWMGHNLKEADRPYPLKQSACYTCRTGGLSCEN